MTLRLVFIYVPPQNTPSINSEFESNPFPPHTSLFSSVLQAAKWTWTRPKRLQTERYRLFKLGPDDVLGKTPTGRYQMDQTRRLLNELKLLRGFTGGSVEELLRLAFEAR